MTLVATGFDSLEISWEPPQEIGTNVIVYIVLFHFDGGNDTYHINPDNKHTMNLTSLTPHTTYNCCVIANTTLGPSSLACATEKTLENSK